MSLFFAAWGAFGSATGFFCLAGAVGFFFFSADFFGASASSIAAADAALASCLLLPIPEVISPEKRHSTINSGAISVEAGVCPRSRNSGVGSFFAAAIFFSVSTDSVTVRPEPCSSLFSFSSAASAAAASASFWFFPRPTPQSLSPI